MGAAKRALAMTRLSHAFLDICIGSSVAAQARARPCSCFLSPDRVYLRVRAITRVSSCALPCTLTVQGRLCVSSVHSVFLLFSEEWRAGCGGARAAEHSRSRSLSEDSPQKLQSHALAEGEQSRTGERLKVQRSVSQCTAVLNNNVNGYGHRRAKTRSRNSRRQGTRPCCTRNTSAALFDREHPRRTKNGTDDTHHRPPYWKLPNA